MKLFDISTEGALGHRLAEYLHIDLSKHEERTFADTEFKIRPLENVCGEQVFVCQPLYADANQSANDRLIRLAFFVGALKDALAERVTAIVPYLAYQRKDRRTKLRDPVSTRYLAQMLESIGLDCLVSVDVHNLAAFENSFRCEKAHIEAAPALVEHFLPMVAAEQKIVVVSPDIGGVQRARAFASLLGESAKCPVDLAFVEKHRSEGIVSGDLFAGDVRDASVIVIDDMICGGTTMERAARVCKQRGAASVHIAATHGIFGAGADRHLGIAEISSVAVLDTIPDARARCPSISHKLQVLDTADLIGSVVQQLVTP